MLRELARVFEDRRRHGIARTKPSNSCACPEARDRGGLRLVHDAAPGAPA
ncbi:MAG: hypothetical protein U1F11_10895 [Steroidobacteraceae bacterium]